MSRKRINFIRMDMRSRSAGGIDATIDRVAVGTLVFIALLTAQSQLSVSKAKHREAILAAEKNSLDSRLAALQAVSQKAADDVKDLQPLADLLKNKVLWSDAFKELSALIGPDVWLESLKSVNKDQTRTVTVTGMATSQQDVNAFFADLENSFFFRNVMIHYSQRKKDYAPALYEFEFSATMPGAPVPAPKVVVAPPRNGRKVARQ